MLKLELTHGEKWPRIYTIWGVSVMKYKYLPDVPRKMQRCWISNENRFNLFLDNQNRFKTSLTCSNLCASWVILISQLCPGKCNVAIWMSRHVQENATLWVACPDVSRKMQRCWISNENRVNLFLDNKNRFKTSWGMLQRCWISNENRFISQSYRFISQSCTCG